MVPLLLLFALFLLLPAAHAGAAAPGDPGPIAFVGERGADRVVYVRRGGRTVGLLRAPVLADPVWSPFGRRIAVTREDPTTGRAIWVYNQDGSGGRQLTASANSGSHASWSPAGRSLTYAAGPIGQRRIHVVRADGQRDRPITAGPEDQHSPVWSAQDQIAFVAPVAGDEEIFRVPSRGGTPRRLTFKTGADKDPAWSPKGDRIAWVRGTGGIWVMSRWGNGKRKVVNPPGGIEEGLSWSPDGKRLVFAAGRPGLRQVFSVKLNGKGLRQLSLPTSNGEDPDWASTGHYPVIAAAGDMACPPTGRSFREGRGTPTRCAAMRTSDLMLQRDLWAVLALGDIQPPYGELDFFYQSFGPSWGRLNSLMRPVPGNHDYGNYRGSNPRAEGYFEYFERAGVRTGNRNRGGYYSYDIGDWHVIALDSSCNNVPGGCLEGSPQHDWLVADLRRNRSRCTLAYWHHPRFSSVAVEGRGTGRQMIDIWRTLWLSGADLVLSGHQHFYERLAPQDGHGNLDREHGVNAFVVGTGGHSLDQAEFRDKNSRAFSADSFGVLELELRPKGYHYAFRSAGPVEFFDSGRGACH